jgi:hypothetical protein
MFNASMTINEDTQNTDDMLSVLLNAIQEEEEKTHPLNDDLSKKRRGRPKVIMNESFSYQMDYLLINFLRPFF